MHAVWRVHSMPVNVHSITCQPKSILKESAHSTCRTRASHGKKVPADNFKFTAVGWSSAQNSRRECRLRRRKCCASWCTRRCGAKQSTPMPLLDIYKGTKPACDASRAGCKLHSTLAVQEVHSVVSDRSLLASSSRKAFSEARSREPAHYYVVTILRCSVQKHPS